MISFFTNILITPGRLPFGVELMVLLDWFSSSQLSFLTRRGIEPLGHDTFGGAAGATCRVDMFCSIPPMPVPFKLPETKLIP
jgi:hypothetical protein